MGQRIVFEFLGDAATAADEWKQVERLLAQANATHVSGPRGAAPQLVTAVLPDQAAAEATVARLRQMPGVGRADVEMLRDAW